MAETVRHWPREQRKTRAPGLSKLWKLEARSSRDLARLVTRPGADNELRVLCAWVLGAIKDKNAIPGLTKALTAENKELIWESALALGKIRGRKAEDALIAAIKQVRNTYRRTAAIAALGYMSSRRTVPQLVRIARDDRLPPRMRGEALEALGRVGGKEAVKCLLNATYNKSSEVRFWAVYGLGQTGQRDVLPRLREIARADHARLKQWGFISHEAKVAMKQIKDAME